MDASRLPWTPPRLRVRRSSLTRGFTRGRVEHHGDEETRDRVQDAPSSTVLAHLSAQDSKKVPAARSATGRQPHGGNKSEQMVYHVARKRAKRWWVVDPRKSRWMAAWDAATTLCLLYTAVVTPFEVAFLDAPRSWTEASRDGLFLTNRVVSLLQRQTRDRGYTAE